MTILANPPSATEPAPEPDPQPTVVDDPPRSAPPAAPDAAFSSSLSPGLFIGWLVLVAVGVLIVWWGLSPSVEQRDQRALLTDYRAQIDSASNEAFGLPGIQVPVNAPALGTPVGVVDAERTGLHVVAVEGSDPAQTRQGAGHIVGTAAPGQPGNSGALVGRSHLYGGAFGSIGDLAAGDRILVTTVQGQSAYTVRIVAHRQITDDAASDTAAPVTTTTAAPTPAADPTVASSASSPSTAPAPAAAGAPAPAAAGPTLPDGPLRPDQLYGPTDDDRLTLVTSDSVVPWSTGDAVVVVAQLDGQPYAPTPQGGRVVGGDGRHGDPGITAALLLAALFMLVAVTAAIWLHRHLPWRSAYLLSAPLVVAATILLAEQLAGTLPGWA